MDTTRYIKVLQQAVGAVDDGYWGKGSQDALIKSGKKVYINFDKMRSKFGRLNQGQVDGVNSIIDACNDYGGDGKNPTYIAYMLATAWHETAHTLQPIREYGRGRGRKYGRMIDITGEVYKGLKHIYYGRGYVQLTWLTNYVKMRKALGVDFVNKPWLALDKDHAADIMLVGMLSGMFTGKSLSGCIHYGLYHEFVNARKIINGTDKDRLIADYAVMFLECLEIK